MSDQPAPTLRSILSRHAERLDASHFELVNQHKDGFRSIRTLYLEDGTMLNDMGGSTLIQHPDNRLAVVFNHNPDKVRRVMTRVEANGATVHLKHPGLAATENLIVIDARDCDRKGLAKSWVAEAVIGYNALTSNSNTHHGILKRTADRTWRSESVSYEILDPYKNKKGELKDPEDVDKHVLACGYGMGLLADNVSEKEKMQRALWRWRRRLTRDVVKIPKDEVYNVAYEHFGRIAPRVLQGFNPHRVTFEKGYETKFSNLIKDRYASRSLPRRVWGYLTHKSALTTSYVVGAGFIVASGVLKTFKMTAIRNITRSVPAAVWQFISRRGLAYIPAAGVAAALFAVYFLSHTIANAKQQQIWTLKDKEDASSSFYAQKDKPEIALRRYQEADPKQMAESLALNVFEYDCVPADAQIYAEEPGFYSLNRLFSTKSVREGSLMEMFRLNGHDISFYDESHGIRRVVIPDLDTAFVTYVQTREGRLQVSAKQKSILNEGEVIKIALNPNTHALEKSVMTYDDYEENLLKITKEFTGRTLCEHPDHESYMEQQEEDRRNQRLVSRLRNSLRFFV